MSKTAPIVAPQAELPVAPPIARGILDTLARLPAQAIVDERALATALGITSRTIRRMIGRGELPAPVPLAGRSVWMAGRVLTFLEQKMEKAEAAGDRRIVAISRQTP